MVRSEDPNGEIPCIKNCRACELGLGTVMGVLDHWLKENYFRRNILYDLGHSQESSRVDDA